MNFNKIIIEEYIEGYELTVFLIGNKEKEINQPLIIGLGDRFYFEKEVFDAESKFKHRRTYDDPLKHISPDTVQQIKQTAEQAYDTLGIRDYGRIDIRLRDNTPYLLEANTVPAIGLSSDVGAICRILGISFEDFILKLLQTINKRLSIMS